MAYQTGVPTDETDLVQQMVIWLVSLGWTNNLSAADVTGWRAHVSKGGMFVNLRSAINENTGGVWPSSIAGGVFVGVMLSVGTGFDGSHAWYDQAGVPTQNVGGALPSGAGFSTYNTSLPPPHSMAPFTRYHFFSDALDNVVVVLERTPANFSVMGWGNLIKKGGVWTGGAYFFSRSGPVYAATPIVPTCECPFAMSGFSGNDNAAWVRADVDTYIGAWLSNYRSLSPGYGKRCATGVFFADAPPVDIPSYQFLGPLLTSQLNSQANLLPIDVYGERDNPSNPGQIGGGFSLLGTVPGIFLTTAGNHGFASGSIYSIGADDYMVFAGAVSPSPWIPGFAIKKT